MSGQLRANRPDPADEKAEVGNAMDTEGPTGEVRDEVKHAVATEAVESPNSVPTNGRFETSTDNYSAGYPASEFPSWLKDATDRFHAEHDVTVANA